MEIGSGGIGNLRTTSNEAIDKAVQRPVEKLARQADDTRVQLSAFGQLRSATAAVEDAAKGLRTGSSVRSAEATRSVARRFVDAVNTGNQLARELTAPGNRNAAAGALGNDVRARAAGNDLRRVLSDDRNGVAADLKGIGIAVSRDGSLNIDQKRFDAALAADPVAVTQTLDRVGERVAAVASRLNSATGSIGRAVESLSVRAASIESRREQAQASAEALQQQIRQQTGGNPFTVGAAQTYRNVFGL